MNFIWEGKGWYSEKDIKIRKVDPAEQTPLDAARNSGYAFPPHYLTEAGDAAVLARMAEQNSNALLEFNNSLEMMAYILVVAPLIGEIAELIASNSYVFSEITGGEELDTLSIAKKVLQFVVKQFNATGGRGMRIRTLYGTEVKKVDE